MLIALVNNRDEWRKRANSTLEHWKREQDITEMLKARLAQRPSYPAKATPEMVGRIYQTSRFNSRDEAEYMYAAEAAANASKVFNLETERDQLKADLAEAYALIKKHIQPYSLGVDDHRLWERVNAFMEGK